MSLPFWRFPLGGFTGVLFALQACGPSASARKLAVVCVRTCIRSDVLLLFPLHTMHHRDIATNLTAHRGSVCGRASLSTFDSVTKLAWEPLVEVCVPPFATQLCTACSACIFARLRPRF